MNCLLGKYQINTRERMPYIAAYLKESNFVGEIFQSALKVILVEEHM